LQVDGIDVSRLSLSAVIPLVRASGLGFVSVVGFRDSGFRFWVSGLMFRVSCFAFRASGCGC